jgi:chorismate mutase
MTQTETALDPVLTGRARIDEIDAALVDLIQERVTVSQQIQRARLASGGPRVVTSRERELVQRWHAALGEAGGGIALRLLDLSRGPL